VVLTGLCFDLKLRKCGEDLFFWLKLETFAKICVAASLETLREDPPYASTTNRLIGNYSAKSLEPPLVKGQDDLKYKTHAQLKTKPLSISLSTFPAPAHT